MTRAATGAMFAQYSDGFGRLRMISSHNLYRALCAMLLAISVAVLGSVAFAQDKTDASAQLRQAEADIQAIGRQAEARGTDADRTLLRARISTTRQAALAAGEQLSGQLTAVDARIAELGPKPAATAEAPEVALQRSNLAAERLSLDAMVKRARLVDVEAGQLADEMQRVDAQQFSARMARRVASPLSPAFWTSVAGSFDADVARIKRFFAKGDRQTGARAVAGGYLIAGLCLVLAALMIGPARGLGLRLGQRYLISDAPGSRFRRSAYALWAVFVRTLAPLLAAVLFVMAVGAAHPAPANWNGLLQAFVTTTGSCAFVAALFGAVLMRSQPSWRIAPISDEVASRLRPLTLILVGITFATSMLEAFNTAVGASGAALAASQAIEAGGSLFLIGGALIAFGRIRASEADREEGVVTHPGLSALSLLLWIVVLAATAGLAFGYVEFARFAVNMIVWAGVVASGTYLLMNALDDGVIALFNRDSGLGQTLVRGVGVRGSAIDQFGVLLSGAFRLILALISFIVLIAPFGAGSGIVSIVEAIASFSDGISVGGVMISPGTIIRGVLILLVGLALVRGFIGWLERRYLPATDLDGSGRNSVSLIARYVGIALAAIWALASLGIGVERIALLLSALSVGIGFGLQAITQNFVSGLILLAERPIKIGDLIKVGNDEGDVKRINVRSTELTLADHSTLIIPNSELITKPVLNKTLSSPLGRLQIQFAVPIEADAVAVERILRDAYAAEGAILDDPAPSIFIDSIADGKMVFNSFAHVAGPRAAYAARSAILKTLLRRLREEDIEVGSAPQRLELVQPPEDAGRALPRGDGDRTSQA